MEYEIKIRENTYTIHIYHEVPQNKPWKKHFRLSICDKNHKLINDSVPLLHIKKKYIILVVMIVSSVA